MTDKTINGVPHELLERAAECMEQANHGTNWARELRALLAAPGPIVEADGIGEPVARQRKSKMHGNCWYPLSSDEVNDAVAAGWEVRSLYSADQLAALQSTIAQLKARIAELEDSEKSMCEMVDLTARAVGDSTGLMWQKIQIAFLQEIPALKAENERLRGEQGQPSLWFVRIPDEPGDPEESPAEYFYTTSVDELNKMLKCPGASVECRYYASPSALKLPIESAFYVAVFALYGFGPDKLCMLDGKDLKRVWNACLDEVRRMNP